ncbi:Ger(x)C family spore germination protein [Paenibacillus tyrfis]|uniref:Ger(x)C family spore germination protein n=1 Tax=Paenibacillus tyrfis TaxID=1501230 RepID=UPI0020A1856A|nr:Ger(x)C family spore germination protein [Paenibacillus tyrfis]MCP1310889.1 Ger(x)C family spore germination protein [Paenibacillus tyrfis]
MSRTLSSRICLALTLLVGLTGCWNRKEIESLGFVIAAGIDPARQGYLFSTQVVNTDAMSKNKSEKTPPYFVYTSTGETIFDAVRKATHTSPNKLFWSHTKMLILSEKTAKQGIKHVLEFFSRDAEERRHFLLAVTPGLAEDVLKADVKTKKIPTLALLELMELYRASSTAPRTTLNDFLRMYQSSTGILLPVVKIIRDQAGKQSYYLAGSAAFRKDTLATYLTPIQTRGVLWVLGKVKSGIIVAKCPGTSGDAPENRVSFEVFKAKSDIKAEKREGRFLLKVTIEESGNLAEASCSHNEIDPKPMHTWEAIKKEKIEAEIKEAIAKAKEAKTDVFGFGEVIHRAYPQDWKKISKQWDDMFPTLNVQVSVETKVTSSALLQRVGGK